MTTFRASCSITTDWMSPLFHTLSSVSSIDDTWMRWSNTDKYTSTATPTIPLSPISQILQYLNLYVFILFLQQYLLENSAWRWPIMLWCRCSYLSTSPQGSKAMTVFLMQRFLKDKAETVEFHGIYCQQGKYKIKIVCKNKDNLNVPGIPETTRE